MLEALSLAHRVAVLDEGTVIACDVPERIVQVADPRIRRLLDAVTLKFRPDA
jgi:ABC-type proline/glycine betaine transport system ATPase subunit